MTNVTHRSTNEIGEIQEHLCLISEQSADDFLAIAFLQQKNIPFVLSEEKHTLLHALCCSEKNARIKKEICDSEIELGTDENSLSINFKESQDSLNARDSLFLTGPNNRAKLGSELLFESHLKKANS